MKKLSIILLCVLCFASVSYAEDVKYEVTLKIVYNAVSPEKASEIISNAQRRHKNACKVEITSKKTSSGDDTFVISGGTTGTLTLECIESESEAIRRCGRDRYTQVSVGGDCFVCY